ncbi:MAG TPA: hypothetical protein VKZ70_05265 [Burkholderiaceae bacterium]|nr:hypothetical protein [Burkholderiaceae bacterium]
MPQQPLSCASTRHVRFFLTTGAALLLSACATMGDIPPGASVSEVQARYGAPSVECPQADGSSLVVWSTQPMGHYAWATRVAPDGSTGALEQVLTDEAFRRVQVNEWTSDQLRCHFGPPAEISSVGLPSVRQTIWSYRYRQSGVWYSLMHFYLSDDGTITRMHPGPDPLFEPLELPFMM